MNFFKKLFSSQSPTRRAEYRFSVKCKRCGEIIVGRIDLANDLSADYDDGETYRVRKVLIGENRCFQRLEATFKFDAQRNLIEKEIVGGEFVA
ncbi:MAG: hypothetical protein LC099_07640 [Anaerolineales bacterium]|nr:hypothetical protein [Anaerolineales bacterium]